MGRRVISLVFLVAWLSGCTFSIVRDGRLVAARYGELVQRTARVRGLPPPDVPARVISREQVPDVLRRAIAAGWSPEALENYQDALVAIGLWPADRDLVEELLRVSREEFAGMYVPAERTLYVVRDVQLPISLRLASMLTRRDLMRETILAHELVHAMQHAAAPGVVATLLLQDQDDAVAAVQAALEGDALRYGFETLLPEGRVDLLPEPESLLEAIRSESAQRTEGALAEAPALIRLTLTFPYAHGYGLSLRRGRALLAAPLASTEQVMHADRRSQDFGVIDLDALGQRLPPGCRVLAQNTLGELGLSVLLRDLSDGGIEPDAWEGWDGDRYLVARCGQRRGFLLWTQWDSDRDAAEFASAYVRIAPRIRERAGLVDEPLLQRDAELVRIASGPLVDRLPEASGLARRSRALTLDELRAHFGTPATRSLAQDARGWATLPHSPSANRR
jgi:hypothetical protein